MKLLLDTHVLLWWLADDDQLSPRARHAIADTANPVFISAVSGWEISIKRKLGRLDLEFEALEAAIKANGFFALPVSFQHGLAAGELPEHHRDPFDRMLVAQAQAEDMRLVSCDKALQGYDVKLLW